MIMGIFSLKGQGVPNLSFFGQFQRSNKLPRVSIPTCYINFQFDIYNKKHIKNIVFIVNFLFYFFPFSFIFSFVVVSHFEVCQIPVEIRGMRLFLYRHFDKKMLYLLSHIFIVSYDLYRYQTTHGVSKYLVKYLAKIGRDLIKKYRERKTTFSCKSIGRLVEY